VKSFSPAGVATKAYYGLGAKTFGNPFGATSGNGGEQLPPAPPPPPGPNFTNRGTPTGNTAYVMQTDGLGTTLLINLTGQVWQSTDGGITWAHIFTLTPFAPVQTLGSFVYAAGTWCLNETGFVYRTKTPATVWSRTSSAAQTGGGGCLATNGAGQWFFIGNLVQSGGRTDSYSHSTDDGISWSAASNVTAIQGMAPPFQMAFALSNYILPSTDPATNFGIVETSTDTVNWTKTNVNPTSLTYTTITALGGKLYGMARDGTLVVATTIAELETPVVSSNTAQSNTWIVHTGTQFVVVADFGIGVVASPNDTGPWTSGNLTLSNTVSGCVYDPVNARVIVCDVSGNIATLP
jgi:hypothetical protein